MILIVDDEEIILELLEEYLDSFNKEILRATSVPEALRLLQSHKFQLVISDIVLKSGRGNSIHTYMRKSGGVHEHTPLLLISGQVPGVDDLDSNSRFLAKPFTQEELIENIRELFPKKANQKMHPLLKNIIGGGS